jgi:hypothetical protein
MLFYFEPLQRQLICELRRQGHFRVQRSRKDIRFHFVPAIEVALFDVRNFPRVYLSAYRLRAGNILERCVTILVLHQTLALCMKVELKEEGETSLCIVSMLIAPLLDGIRSAGCIR